MSSTSSTWATWPLIVGICIPIAGLAILSALGTVFYIRHRRRERSERQKDTFNQSGDLERSSESSNSTNRTSAPIASRHRIERPGRPPRLRINTQDRLLAISKERLETIQEGMRPSQDVRTPQRTPLLAKTLAQSANVQALELPHTRVQSQGGRTASSQSLDQDTLRWLSTGAEGYTHLPTSDVPSSSSSSSPSSPSSPSHAQSRSNLTMDELELNDLSPQTAVRQEPWNNERKGETGNGLGEAL